ncbi:hypothetical protein BC938DRAFT_474511 [Jimgerdemannia flammicorona]|uniref:Uncharacterized protein n=1 Tax=Jimgerdemannia flammicorona TaxID=994334 RepID=A0A433Q279_9FUNG|nr:hypothetical protein BC938DRAFT_474511 [Jimgerdemannia flammicorona]
MLGRSSDVVDASLFLGAAEALAALENWTSHNDASPFNSEDGRITEETKHVEGNGAISAGLSKWQGRVKDIRLSGDVVCGDTGPTHIRCNYPKSRIIWYKAIIIQTMHLNFSATQRHHARIVCNFWSSEDPQYLLQ